MVGLLVQCRGTGHFAPDGKYLLVPKFPVIVRARERERGRDRRRLLRQFCTECVLQHRVDERP